MSGFMVPELWCDLCSERAVADDQRTITELRRAMRRRGWRVERQGGRRIDVCPSHSGGAETNGDADG